MKKITILGACIICAFGAIAQQPVVKEAEKAMKAKQPLTKVVAIIKPALTNADTKDLAQTWFIPGKAAFNEYDELLGLQQFGKLPKDGEKTMGTNLIEGYEYFCKALPLDSLPDAKGKVKPKYSKDIYNILAGHFNDYNNNAVGLYNAKDYKGAYRAWEIYLDMAADPVKYKGIIVPNDTIISEVMYNQGIAAWQDDDLQKALKAFLAAKDKGYTKKNLYDYAINVARAANDTTAFLSLAREALPLYGSEDPIYLRLIINDYLVKKQYDKALVAIEDALKNDPNNYDYYIVLGMIQETNKNYDKAQEAYKKALDLAPESSNANFYYGKSICDQAYIINDTKAPTDPYEYDAFFKSTLKPLFESAVPYLEKAYDLDNENLEPLKYLQNVYYNLKDDKKLKEVEMLLK